MCQTFIMMMSLAGSVIKIEEEHQKTLMCCSSVIVCYNDYLLLILMECVYNATIINLRPAPEGGNIKQLWVKVETTNQVLNWPRKKFRISPNSSMLNKILEIAITNDKTKCVKKFAYFWTDKFLMFWRPIHKAT